MGLQQWAGRTEVIGGTLTATTAQYTLVHTSTHTHTCACTHTHTQTTHPSTPRVGSIFVGIAACSNNVRFTTGVGDLHFVFGATHQCNPITNPRQTALTWALLLLYGAPCPPPPPLPHPPAPTSPSSHRQPTGY